MPVLRGNKNFYDYDVSDILKYNLETWLDYGLLEMGAYTNATFNNAQTSGLCTLQRTYDDTLGGFGRCYEGMGPGWVWETGITPIQASGTTINPPFQVSGVYINNTFYPISTSGTYAHKVDYRRGRIVFDNKIPTSSVVKCEYSFKDIGIYTVDSKQWKTIVQEYETWYSRIGELAPSGVGAALKEHRLWLPSVYIGVYDGTSEALQLGGGELAICTVRYFVFSDKPFVAQRLADTLNNQKEKVLTLFDINAVPTPLKNNGTLNTTHLTYPSLADREGQYFWTYAQIEDSSGGVQISLSDLYRAYITQNIVVQRYNRTY